MRDWSQRTIGWSLQESWRDGQRCLGIQQRVLWPEQQRTVNSSIYLHTLLLITYNQFSTQQLSTHGRASLWLQSLAGICHRLESFELFFTRHPWAIDNLFLQDDEVVDWVGMAAKHEEEQRKRWAKCPTLIKSFYTEHPEVTEMTKEAVDKFREENNKIQLSNFDKESSAPLMSPVPK